MPGQDSPNFAKSILYVEDDELTRRCIANRLRRCGFTVHEAASEDAALKAMSETEGPDLLLLDLDLQGSDGLRVHTHIRRLFPDVRTVVCSGALADVCLTTLKSVVGYDTPILSKPCRFEQLVSALEQAIAKPVTPSRVST